MFDFVAPVRNALRAFDLDVARVHFHAADEYMWGVQNLSGDAIAQLATSYTATQVGVFKKIVRRAAAQPG